MTVVAGSLAFRELSLGRVRLAIDVLVGLGLAIAIAGVIFFVFTGVNDKFIPENNLLAVVLLVLLAAVAAVPTLSRKYLLLPNRGVLAVGTMIFCAEAVCVNLLRPLGFVTPTILDHVGFAVLLFSFGYSAVEMVSSNEHRLRAIEGELEAARQLQFSILPSTIPEMLSLRIAATYKPMTAVAGDFYEFLPVDECRAGFFIADVSGHGVPAALIASMIKVAVQTVAASADRPDEVLRSSGKFCIASSADNLFPPAFIFGWILKPAMRAIRQRDILLCCAGDRLRACSPALKAMAFCLAYCRVAIIPSGISPSVAATASCSIPTAWWNRRMPQARLLEITIWNMSSTRAGRFLHPNCRNASLPVCEPGSPPRPHSTTI